MKGLSQLHYRDLLFRLVKVEGVLHYRDLPFRCGWVKGLLYMILRCLALSRGILPCTGSALSFLVCGVNGLFLLLWPKGLSGVGCSYYMIVTKVPFW